MSPHIHLLFLSLLAICTVLFEAEWIKARLWSGNTAKLPHRTVLLIRWGIIAGYVLIWCTGWAMLFTFILLAALLGPLHSVGLNLRRNKSWWYLGPWKRTQGDSWWDERFIALASPTPKEDASHNKVYDPKPRWLPMAYLIGTCLFIALIAHALLMQT